MPKLPGIDVEQDKELQMKQWIETWQLKQL